MTEALSGGDLRAFGAWVCVLVTAGFGPMVLGTTIYGWPGVLVGTLALAACSSGDVNINPQTAVTDSNNTTISNSGGGNTNQNCASFVRNGQTLQGTDDGNGQALRVGDFKLIYEKGPMWSTLSNRPAGQNGGGPANSSALNDWWFPSGARGHIAKKNLTAHSASGSSEILILVLRAMWMQVQIPSSISTL